MKPLLSISFFIFVCVRIAMISMFSLIGLIINGCSDIVLIKLHTFTLAKQSFCYFIIR